MNAGKLRQRIIFQNQSGQDEYGRETWVTVLTVWADVQPSNATELEESDQLLGSISHKIVCRYRSEIDRKHQILFNNRQFRILGLININERNKELEILCEELTDD